MPDRPAPDPDDPKGLIRESFRIEGITDAECRSILVDWALSLEAGRDARAAMRRLLDRHAPPAEHPMTRLLCSAGTLDTVAPVRRGGRAGRIRRSDDSG